MDFYFINLDRVPDRAAFMIEQFAYGGIPNPTRVSAIDASSIEDFSSPRYQPHSWGPYWSMTPTEIAVFESHRSTWEAIVRSDQPGAIFEDDALLSSTAGGSISALAASPTDFDLIKLDSLGGLFRFGPAIKTTEQNLRKIFHVLPSAAAYLLSPNGAAKLLHHSQSYCDHLDDFITRPRVDFHAFQLDPGIAVQGQ